MPMQRRLNDRIALITGASRGIGRAVALAYAREGAHVVLLARTRGALEELDDEIKGFGGRATLVPLNLKHAQKIDALGPSLYERWGRLDIFVANAATLGPLSPLGHIHDTDWQNVQDINLFANWRLIRSLDPLLHRSDSGRAIFVSSHVSRSCNAYWGPYSVSKAALEALAMTYAAEVASTLVRVNIIKPGPIATKMRERAFPGEDPATLKQPEDLAKLFVELASPALTANGEVFDFE